MSIRFGLKTECDNHAELDLEEPMEQAQVEEFTNLALDKGKPRCI
jgi:hypothetical protein